MILFPTQEIERARESPSAQVSMQIMARRRLDSFRYAAEQRFQHKVDMEVPVGGFGQRLNEMHDWCRENAAPDDWAEHSYREKLTPGQVPRDYARFYFEHSAMADLFVTVWGDELVEQV